MRDVECRWADNLGALENLVEEVKEDDHAKRKVLQHKDHGVPTALDENVPAADEKDKRAIGDRIIGSVGRELGRVRQAAQREVLLGNRTAPAQM